MSQLLRPSFNKSRSCYSGRPARARRTCGRATRSTNSTTSPPTMRAGGAAPGGGGGKAAAAAPPPLRSRRDTTAGGSPRRPTTSCFSFTHGPRRRWIGSPTRPWSGLTRGLGAPSRRLLPRLFLFLLLLLLPKKNNDNDDRPRCRCMPSRRGTRLYVLRVVSPYTHEEERPPHWAPVIAHAKRARRGGPLLRVTSPAVGSYAWRKTYHQPEQKQLLSLALVVIAPPKSIWYSSM